MTVDLRWEVPEANQLWVTWDKVAKIGNGKVELINAEFTGPVTHDYIELEQIGNLKLDFTNHFIIVIDGFYIVELSWDSVKSQEVGSIKFDKIILHDENVGLLDKIKDVDKLLVDCTDQTDTERGEGNYKMVYGAMLYDELNQSYDFGTK